MTTEIDSAALRNEIAAAYGVEISSEVCRGETGDAARVLLADRIATAIHNAAAAPYAKPAAAPPSWTPLPLAPVAASRSPVDPATATARLLAWARAGGARFEALEIRTSAAGYRTGHAHREIAAGEQILHVPRALQFDLERAQSTSIGKALAASGLALASERTPLALGLLVERNDPQSRWQPYLDGLPPQLPAMPLFQDAASLAPLAGSAVMGDLRARRDAIVNDHVALVGWMTTQGDLGFAVTLADLAWAHAICGSRTFATTIAGTPGCALIPIADCCDHGAGDARWGYDDAAGGLVVTAERKLAAGEPIHFSYGQKSNARLFAGYGFCVPDNPADVAHLVVPRRELDVRGDLIARLLWDRPLGAPWQVQVGRQFDDDTILALSQARVAVATDRELMMALDGGCFGGRRVRWISERNEAAAWAALAAAAAALLAALPPAFDDDQATPTARVIHLLLRGERQVLEAWNAFAIEVPPLLRAATRWDVRRITATADERLIDPYLTSLAGELR